MVWKGDSGANNWDTSSSNWLNGVSVDRFFNNDGVTFNDTGSENAALPVHLLGALAPSGHAALPATLMPCSPPRPTFSGGTGAFHSDHFQSDYVTAPVLGAADVPNANFTNVYIWPDPASETWDAHTGPLLAPSMSTIDGMTQALVCSSYFDLLTQYNINPPSFSGDEITFQQPCVNNALADASARRRSQSAAGTQSSSVNASHSFTA